MFKKIMALAILIASFSTPHSSGMELVQSKYAIPISIALGKIAIGTVGTIGASGAMLSLGALFNDINEDKFCVVHELNYNGSCHFCTTELLKNTTTLLKGSLSLIKNGTGNLLYTITK